MFEARTGNFSFGPSFASVFTPPSKSWLPSTPASKPSSASAPYSASPAVSMPLRPSITSPASKRKTGAPDSASIFRALRAHQLERARHAARVSDGLPPVRLRHGLAVGQNVAVRVVYHKYVEPLFRGGRRKRGEQREQQRREQLFSGISPSTQSVLSLYVPRLFYQSGALLTWSGSNIYT